jgi:hypothetical protein
VIAPKGLTKAKLVEFVYRVARLPREPERGDSTLNELIGEAQILLDIDPLRKVRKLKNREDPALYTFTPTWEDAQWLAAEVNRNGYTRDGYFVAGKFWAELLDGRASVVFGEVAKKQE